MGSNLLFNEKHVYFWLYDAESTDFSLVKDGTKLDVSIIGGEIVWVATRLIFKNQGIESSYN